MPTSADAIDSALQEVDRARTRVSRLTARQVTNADDRDYLKSVAYSWFRSHRPLAVGCVSEEALGTVDAPLRDVLAATARSSARTTYLELLKDAKRALAALRGSSLLSPLQSPSPVEASPPDFTALASDPAMRVILERRWNETQRCLRAGAPLAATVMMGGLLEALFVARVNLMSNKGPLFRAKGAPLDSRTKKPLPLQDWTLRPYIDVGAELGWISRSGRDVAAVLRDYRNYIHPEKERSHGVVLTDRDSSMFWEVTKSLAGQLLASAGQSAHPRVVRS